MGGTPKTNDLPEVIDLRGVTADQLAENWILLSAFGRQEILIRCGVGVRGDNHLDKCMHEHLANLPGLVTGAQLQKAVDILARHGETSGLHYASEYNTVVNQPASLPDDLEDFYPPDSNIPLFPTPDGDLL